jgi:hypothetical protein
MCNIPLLLHLKQELVQLLLQLHQLQLVVAIEKSIGELWRGQRKVIG